MTSKLFYFMALLLSAYALEFIEYEGLRLDLSALTLNRDILGTIIPALNRTEHCAFASIKETGSFWSELEIKNIRIPSFKINEERFDMNKFEFNWPVYKLKGGFESIYFTITFHFTMHWLGIPINSGTGTAAVTNINNEILVLWNESDPDVLIPHPWDIKNISLTSIFPPTSWAKTMLHTHFIPEFHRAVDESMFDFAHKLLKTYRFIEDVFPDDIDLIFRNDIIEVKPSMGNQYLSIAFKTNITVDNNIHKRIKRRMNGTIVPRGDMDYCLAAQLVPDVMDALGKGGYYDEEIEGKIWGFESNTVKELFSILPSLKDKYTGSESFAIHCITSKFETVNDVTQRGYNDPLLELQNPVYCFVYVQSTGDFLFIADIYFRFYYELKCKGDAFYGHIRAPVLKDFKTTPLLPESRKAVLAEHIQMYTNHFFDKELISPGIRVLPNREKELNFDWAYTMSEEICFYYKEKKPILNNN